ncbi:hypothetical protein [Colwellia sp. PAMC 21821]|uniref:hypothetical protein n=1 Tax=Colwellia sp. PAMC 21821 TaxID=1816219 RepID=UPI0018C8C778|nr:hypothetical protein [Colwellia sp. PAMC 21821]
MKVYAEKLVETVVDKICDVCEQSVMIEVNKYKYEESGELRANFGYGSKEDGKIYQLDLCESCFKTALNALRDLRRTEFMFDETKDSSDERFGLVSDSFMIEQEEIIEKVKGSEKSILSDVNINENVSDDESLQDSIDEDVHTK